MSTSAAVLDGDSVLILYGEYGDGRSGNSVVVGASGLLERSPVVFHPGATVGPSAVVLGPNAALVTYRDDSDNSSGKYVVIDPVSGAVTRPESTFFAGGTGLYYFAAGTDPSTVLIAFRSDLEGNAGKFVVVDPVAGVIKVPETVFNGSGINTLAVAAMDATRVLIAYDEYPGMASHFFTVNASTGQTVLPEVTFESTFGITSITRIDETRAVVFYRDAGGLGEFVVVDTVTGQVSAPVTYSTSQPWDFSVSSAMLGSNAFVLAYWNTSEQVAKLAVFLIDGTVAVPETTFNADGPAYLTSTVSLGCRTLIAFQDVADGQRGKFVVYGGSGTLEIPIDVKPGAFPNVIRLSGPDTVPVALLGSAVLDATTVDPLSVQLAGAPVARKSDGTPRSSVEDVNVDGYLDLLVRVVTGSLQLTPADTRAVLTARTFSGREATGSDSVIVEP